MNERDTVIKVLNKYDFHQPVSPADQKKIRKSKVRVLKRILRAEKKDSAIVSVIVNIYYWIQSMGIPVSLARSARVLNIASATIIITFCVSTFLVVQEYIYDLPGARGNILFVRGDALISSPGKKARKAIINEEILKNDEITVGAKSQLTLQIGNDVIIKLLPETSVRVRTLFESGNMQLDLNKGLVLSKISPEFAYKSYVIKTKNCIATVKGTVFSTTYSPGKTIVVAKDGIVDIQHINNVTGESLDTRTIDMGKTAVLSDKILVRKSHKAEMLITEKVSIVPFIKDAEDKTRIELEKTGMEIEVKEKLIDKEIDKIKPAKSLSTLKGIKNKYGRIDIIQLYSGKVYRGVILSRGPIFRILTTRGVVGVEAIKVKSTGVMK